MNDLCVTHKLATGPTSCYQSDHQEWMTYQRSNRICADFQGKENESNYFGINWLRGKDLNLRPLGYENPKLALPSVPLHCPCFPKSSDFIALDCPPFGNRIGDSCPALPWVPQRIGDRIGDEFRIAIQSRNLPASSHAGS